MGIELLRTEIANSLNQRYKLIFLSLQKTNKLTFLNDLTKEGIPPLNISLTLSEKLRLIHPDKRPYEVANCLRQSIAYLKKEAICLYNLEYLFDPELKQNPVKLLEAHSGNTVLLVIWPGKAENGVLYYATPEHPEYYQNSEYSNSMMIY